MSKSSSISSSVIRRLPRYYRFIGELIKKGITRISSRELAERMGLSASQIRQDLNCFGGFGQQGYGYNLVELREEIGKILGVDKKIKIILIGAGNLGRAIAAHMNFEQRGCELVGIFDKSPFVSGETVSGLRVMDMSEIEDFCSKKKPIIAILCIPKTAAQEIANQLVQLGIKAFWNFSHYDLRVELEGCDILVENVHLGDSLLTLTYRVNNPTQRNAKKEEVLAGKAK